MRLTTIAFAILYFFTPFALSMSETPKPPKPALSAEKVKITFTADSDPKSVMPVRLLEGIEIWPAKDERNITQYNVYWGDFEQLKLGRDSAPRIAQIPVRGDGKKIAYEFPDNFKMEVGAAWVIVCSENKPEGFKSGVEYCEKANNMDQVFDPLMDVAQTLFGLKSLVKDSSAIAGVNIMASCGDLICNGVETKTSCPADCETYGLASFNYQTLCKEVQQVFHPTSVAEIQQIIKQAAKDNRRVKVTSGQGYNETSGSATTLVCSDGIILVMNKFNHFQNDLAMKLETFEGREVVNVASGTNLHQLGEWLYQRDKGLGYVHLGWRDVSVAGALGTSAHGSSPKHRNVLSQQVASMDIITANGELQTFSEGTTGETDPDLWKSLTTHLGYFGVITRVRLWVDEATNTQVKVTFHDEDELFQEHNNAKSSSSVGSVLEDIKECDYGQYNWFPSLDKYLRTCGKTTVQPVELGATNELLFPFVDLSQFTAKETMQVLQLGAANVESGAHESMAYMRHSGWHITPPLTKTINGKKRYTSNATGPTYRITSSKLIDTVGREMFQMDWEVAVPEKNVQAAMEYVRKFTNGLNAKGRDLPVPLIGIFVRFSKAENNALMAYTGAGNGFENESIVAHIETPIFVPVDLSKEQFAEYMSPYEDMMRVLVVEYGARGHWGKNMHSHNPWLFELQRDIGSYGNHLARFSNKVGELDPNGMFANSFAKSIGIKYPNFEYPESW